MTRAAYPLKRPLRTRVIGAALIASGMLLDVYACSLAFGNQNLGWTTECALGLMALGVYLID